METHFLKVKSHWSLVIFAAGMNILATWQGRAYCMQVRQFLVMADYRISGLEVTRGLCLHISKSQMTLKLDVSKIMKLFVQRLKWNYDGWKLLWFSSEQPRVSAFSFLRQLVAITNCLRNVHFEHFESGKCLLRLLGSLGIQEILTK